MKLTYNLLPTAEDVDFLSTKLKEEGEALGICSPAAPFGVFIHNEEGKMIAGANGTLIYGFVYVDQLWVDAAYRGQGLGRKVMEKVHELGRDMGCSLSTVITLSFQGAKEFYERLGYECDFTRSGYIADSDCLFFKKVL